MSAPTTPHKRSQSGLTVVPGTSQANELRQDFKRSLGDGLWLLDELGRQPSATLLAAVQAVVEAMASAKVLAVKGVGRQLGVSA